jgi:hypothetical protein
VEGCRAARTREDGARDRCKRALDPLARVLPADQGCSVKERIDEHILLRAGIAEREGETALLFVVKSRARDSAGKEGHILDGSALTRMAPLRGHGARRKKIRCVLYSFGGGVLHHTVRRRLWPPITLSFLHPPSKHLHECRVATLERLAGISRGREGQTWSLWSLSFLPRSRRTQHGGMGFATYTARQRPSQRNDRDRNAEHVRPGLTFFGPPPSVFDGGPPPLAGPCRPPTGTPARAAHVSTLISHSSSPSPCEGGEWGHAGAWPCNLATARRFSSNVCEQVPIRHPTSTREQPDGGPVALPGRARAVT